MTSQKVCRALENGLVQIGLPNFIMVKRWETLWSSNWSWLLKNYLTYLLPPNRIISSGVYLKPLNNINNAVAKNGIGVIYSIKNFSYFLPLGKNYLDLGWDDLPHIPYSLHIGPSDYYSVSIFTKLLEWYTRTIKWLWLCKIVPGLVFCP